MSKKHIKFIDDNDLFGRMSLLTNDTMFNDLRKASDNFNADFTYQASDALFVAFGYEARSEEYTLVAGQPESYLDGGLASQGFSLSSNGYPGFPAAAAG